jgi:hypothetical protein
MTVLRKALDMQAQGSLELIAALPQVALASGGHLGTRLNAYA